VLWAEHVARNTAGVRDDVYAQARQHFDEAEMVELTGVCGLFGLSNRFQDTMHLPIEEQGEVDRIRQSVRADPERIRRYLRRLVDDWPADGNAPAAADTSGGGRLSEATGARVSLPKLENAAPDAARFLRAARALLGGAPNAMRIWAHVPHVGKLLVPFRFVLERSGAGNVLPPEIRVLARLRTARENKAAYSLAHARALARESGLHEAALAAAVDDDGNEAALAPRERSALAWATAMAPNAARRRDDLFAELRRHFDDAQVVELTALCAMANMTDRIHNALRVPPEPEEDIAALNRPAAISAARVKAYLEQVLADWPDRFPMPR
jgi:alkylhydroperoxidase family enzyme